MSQLNISDWNILVVDDEPDNLNLLEDILSFYDARVVSSCSGEEAVKLLDSQTFALALIDIQMPNVSGWDMIKHIRSSDKSEMRALVVIGVTAHAMPGDRERVLNAGFDGYMSKPIEAETFMDSVMDIVRSRQTPQKPTQPVESGHQPLAEAPLSIKSPTLVEYPPQQNMYSIEQPNKATSDTRENPAAQQ